MGTGNDAPSWSEFIAAIGAQRGEFLDAIHNLQTSVENELKDLKSEVAKNTDRVEGWIKELKEDGDREHGEMKKDLEVEVKRLDERINRLMTISISIGVLLISALVGLVIDVLKLKLF